LIIEINTQSTSPLYEQLRDQIVLGIAAKKLALSEPLPSVRGLAADLGINFHTVNKAYSMLCDEGYIVIDRRKGAMVAQTATDSKAFLSKLSQQLSLSAAEAICHDMNECDFIATCTACYQKAKGVADNGGSL
jgi:DNA-binding transcriptional regulator YhcF (GntR family)